MHLSDHSLRQIDDAYLRALGTGGVVRAVGAAAGRSERGTGAVEPRADQQLAPAEQSGAVGAGRDGGRTR